MIEPIEEQYSNWQLDHEYVAALRYVIFFGSGTGLASITVRPAPSGVSSTYCTSFCSMEGVDYSSVLFARISQSATTYLI